MYEFKDKEFPTGLDESITGSGADIATLITARTPKAIKELSSLFSDLVSHLKGIGDGHVTGDINTILNISKEIEAITMKLKAVKIANAN
jgi:hypothetical protein